MRPARRLGAALAGLALAASVRAAERRVPVQLVFPHPDFSSIPEIRFEPAPAAALAGGFSPASAVEAAPAALTQAATPTVSKTADPVRPAQASLEGLASAESRAGHLGAYYTGAKNAHEPGFVHFMIKADRAVDISRQAGLDAEKLLQRLVPAAKNFARSPVSNYRVGAAALGKSGNIYLGVNLEFPGFPLNTTIHGEQFVVALAHSAGESGLIALALSAAPCGHCRQFLNELGADLRILTPDSAPKFLSALLPESFGPGDLGVEGGLLTPRLASLRRPKNPLTPLASAAFEAAARSYAPYSRAASGVSLRTKDGKVYLGSYLENAAFNPTLSPLQSALVALVADHKDYRDIEEAVLVVEDRAADQSSLVRDLLSSIAPKARLSVVRLRSPGDAPASAPPRAKRPSSTAARLLRATAVGVGASALSPLLWSATTAVEAFLLLAVAITPVAAAGALLIAARGVRAARRRLSGSARLPAPPPRRTLAIYALGVSVGVALTAAAALGQRPAMESAHAYIDARRPAEQRVFQTKIPGAFFASETARALAATPDGRAALARVSGRDGAARMPAFFLTQQRQPVRALPGTFFADAAVVLLSRNPAGREVLDGLRDRGGVVRMPAFFVSHQEDSAAFYTPLDAVYLSAESIEEGGVTVAEFLRDPAAQAAYLEREQATIVHELAHAAQMRRPLSNVDVRTFLKTNASRLAAAIEAYASARAGAPPAASRSAAVKDAPQRTIPTPGAEAAAAPVYLDAAEIARSGLAVPRFLKDESSQKQYILGHQAALARAIHPQAIAAPASPAASGAAARPAFHVDFGMIQEWEYEAHLVEHLYTHERLKANPAADVSNGNYARYVGGLVDFDDFLRAVDGYKVYAFNFHGSSPRYARYMAGMRERWDAHRVEANILLARRALAQNRPLAAKGFLEKARLIAAEKGLPAPDLRVGPLSSVN